MQNYSPSPENVLGPLAIQKVNVTGKISFCEIVDILSRSERFKHIENIDSVILNIYKQYDKERLIVWKRSL